MKRVARIASCFVLSIIVLIGVGLIFVTRLDPGTQQYNSQTTVCSFEYAIQLNPSQAKTNNCAVIQNDWLQLSVESNLNVTLTIYLAKVSGGQINLFNNTSTNLNASFPIPFSGAIISVLNNTADNVSVINGSLTVMAEAPAIATLLSTVEPYRTVGEALVGIGALAIFLVVWNPPLSAETALRAIPERRGSNG
jgi:hypothetical protein